MFIEGETIDDLLNDILRELISIPFNIKATKGVTSEMFGVLLLLKNPLSRLSITETRGKPFSALGELFWYLSGNNDLSFIEHYIPNYKKYSEDSLTVYGGYGPRLFNMNGQYNQIKNVIRLLQEKQSTRRAVIQIYKVEDSFGSKLDIPCTCSMQFSIRDNKLQMIVFMRSNDAYLGLPHDIFCFTMIQELIARSLNIEVGYYYHSVGSLHLYESNIEQVKKYLSEGFQSTTRTMPRMPNCDPWEKLEIVKYYESRIRAGESIDLSNIKIDDYWLDIIRLFMIHYAFKKNLVNDINSIRTGFIFNIYIEYINMKLKQKNYGSSDL